MRRLLLWLLLVLSLLLALPLASPAQTTEDALRTRLLHQPLYLRQPWALDTLHFDSSGNPLGKVPLTSFTLSGVEIKTVQLKDRRLQLDGVRVGLEFAANVPKRILLQEPGGFGPGTHNEAIRLTVDAPADGDYTAALDAILTPSLADLVPRLPLEWQPFAVAHLPGKAAPDAVQPLHSSGLSKLGGSVTAPKVLSAPEPAYTPAARALRYSGVALVYLQVDPEGHPTHVRIVRPIGLGLEEQAMRAVYQYRFKPALNNGTPVTVELNVAVNFQIF